MWQEVLAAAVLYSAQTVLLLVLVSCRVVVMVMSFMSVRLLSPR